MQLGDPQVKNIKGIGPVEVQQIHSVSLSHVNSSGELKSLFNSRFNCKHFLLILEAQKMCQYQPCPLVSIALELLNLLRLCPW